MPEVASKGRPTTTTTPSSHHYGWRQHPEWRRKKWARVTLAGLKTRRRSTPMMTLGKPARFTAAPTTKKAPAHKAE